MTALTYIALCGLTLFIVRETCITRDDYYMSMYRHPHTCAGDFRYDLVDEPCEYNNDRLVYLGLMVLGLFALKK